jgi:hypothetical protein
METCKQIDHTITNDGRRYTDQHDGTGAPKCDCRIVKTTNATTCNVGIEKNHVALTRNIGGVS